MLQNFLKKWNLEDPEELTETPTSFLYKVGSPHGPAVLKILKPLGAEDEKGGAAALKAFGGHGAVRLLQSDRQAQLLEFAEGPELTEMAAGRDDEASAIIANVLNALHGATPAKKPATIVPLERRFRSLFERAKSGAAPYVKAAAIARRLLDTAEKPRLLHGDMHHENVRRTDRGWLAIDPKGLWGERAYDAANVLCNPHRRQEIVLAPGRLERQAAILADVLQIDHDRLLSFTFAYAALSAVWSMEDGEDPSLALAVAARAEPLLAPQR